MIRDKACIVGIGETAVCRKPGSGLGEMALQLKAALAAIDDAGLKAGQIDGIIPFPNLGKAEAFAANLGCADLRFAVMLNMGGASPVAALRVAAMAVVTGAADHVLVPAGWKGFISAQPARWAAPPSCTTVARKSLL